MPGPMPSHSGAGFYSPGAIDNEYEKAHNKPALPGAGLPNPNDTGGDVAAAAVITQSGFYDESAPDVLDLIKGGTFNPPFTVTLMRREGMMEFKSDAGVKREANFKLCKETIRDPADLLRINAGIKQDVYKPLNNMTLDFQLMLYLAAQHGALDRPATPTPAPEAAPASQDEVETVES